MRSNMDKREKIKDLFIVIYKVINEVVWVLNYYDDTLKITNELQYKQEVEEMIDQVLENTEFCDWVLSHNADQFIIYEIGVFNKGTLICQEAINSLERKYPEYEIVR